MYIIHALDAINYCLVPTEDNNYRVVETPIFKNKRHFDDLGLYIKYIRHYLQIFMLYK